MRRLKLTPSIIGAIFVFAIIYFFCYMPMHGYAKEAYVQRVENVNFDEYDVKNGKDKLTITMFDVLHGDAILLQDAKQNILIDVGHPSSKDALIRKLNEKGINRIHTVIISHHHLDHMGNIFTLAGRYKVGRIYDNGLVNSSNTTSIKLHDVLSKGNYRNKALKAGDRINFGRGFWMDILSPGDFLSEGLRRNLNNNSIVMKMHYKDFTMMFTGDIQNPTEVALADKYGSMLKSDVLKVAHHGSKTSSNYQFISKVKPNIALISCGDFSKYHHPNKNVIGSLTHLGAKVYYTNTNGDIVVTTNGKEYFVKTSK